MRFFLIFFMVEIIVRGRGKKAFWGLVQRCLGLAISYRGLPDGQASIEHKCGIVGCYF